MPHSSFISSAIPTAKSAALAFWKALYALGRRTKLYLSAAGSAGILKLATIHPLPAFVRSDAAITPTLKYCALSSLGLSVLALGAAAPAYYLLALSCLILSLPLIRHGLKLSAEKAYFATAKDFPQLNLAHLLKLFITTLAEKSAQASCLQALEDGIQQESFSQEIYWQQAGAPLLPLLRQAVYLGEGYVWDAAHLNAFEQLFLAKEPSSFFNYPRGAVIHALGRDRLQPIFLPTDHLTSHTLIFGTTGSGKSTLLALLIGQALMRRECVVILDPKSDTVLMEQVRQAALCLGLTAKLEFLDLSGAGSTVQLNPLSRFNRASEIADRLTASLPSTGQSMTFKAYVQTAICAAVALLSLQGKPITLEALRQITGHHDNFLLGLEEYLDKLQQQLNREEVTVFWQRLHGKNVPTSQASDPSGDAAAILQEIAQSNPPRSRGRPRSSAAKSLKVDHLMKFYHWLCKHNYVQKNPDFFAVVDITRLDADYYTKVTAALKPLLNLLTMADLTDLLSSTARSASSLSDLVNEHKILYVALSCLSDAVLGANLGKLLMADLRALAGQTNAARQHDLFTKLKSDKAQAQAAYDPLHPHDIPNLQAAPPHLNAGPSGALDATMDAAAPVSVATLPRINVFIDEAAEIIDESTVQLLNKGRSCGFALTLATQSAADLRSRLSESGAQQVLANCNTLISLRLLDQDSARAVAASFPEVPSEDISYGINYSEDFTATLTYGGNKSVDYHSIPLAPPALLANLKNLHYIARLGDGRIIKGQIPRLHFTAPSAQKEGA